MIRNLVLLACVSAVPLWGQMSGFSKEDLLKYTRLNPFERFEDGRPKIPDELLGRLSIATSTAAWGPLQSTGFINQYSSGWKVLHPEKRLVGRAVTALFLPRRPDVEEVIEAEAKAAGLGPGTTAARDRLPASGRRSRGRRDGARRGCDVRRR